MRPEKNRIDTSSGRVPLTDNPFAHLAAKVTDLPAPRPAEPATAKPTPRRADFEVEKTRKGGYNLAIEKRSSGKVVTVLRGISRGDDALLVRLKKLCGAGGAKREDGIEVQGDHRDRIERFLRELAT